MVHLKRPKPKKVDLAQPPGQDSDQPKLERYYIEYVDLSADEAAANEPLRKAVSERRQRGWKLVSLSLALDPRSRATGVRLR